MGKHKGKRALRRGGGRTYRISRLGIGKLLADKIPQRGLDVRLLIVEDEVLAPLIGEDARVVHLSNAVSQLVFGVGDFYTKTNLEQFYPFVMELASIYFF